MGMEEEKKKEEALREEIEDVLRFFDFGHLAPKLQETAAGYENLATKTARVLDPETVAALRRLLEARDAAVRARFAALGREEGSNVSAFDLGARLEPLLSSEAAEALKTPSGNPGADDSAVAWYFVKHVRVPTLSTEDRSAEKFLPQANLEKLAASLNDLAKIEKVLFWNAPPTVAVVANHELRLEQTDEFPFFRPVASSEPYVVLMVSAMCWIEGSERRLKPLPVEPDFDWSDAEPGRG